MFKKRNIRPFLVHHNDQLPFLSQRHFSALPRFRAINNPETGLSLIITSIYVIDLIGVLPFVTLPGVIIPLGFLAIPLALIIVGSQIYTSLVLCKCWILAELLDPTITQKSRYPYAAISDMAYGKHISLVVTILLDVGVFATGIPNLVVASQNLQLIGSQISDGQFYLSFCYWLVVIGVLVCPLMWLGSPKKMRGLALVSVLVVVSIVILLTYCLLKAEGVRKPFQGMASELPSFTNVLGAYCVLAFQFDIHSMILTIQMDMQDKEKAKYASVSGVLTTCCCVVMITVIVAYKFGSYITPNLLEMLPRSGPLYALILLISLQLCLSCIVGSLALFLHVEEIFQVPEKLSAKRIIIRSSLIGFEVLLGEFVPKLDVLIGIVGGTIIGPLMFILPPLLYRKMKQMEKMRERMISQAAYGSFPIDLNYEHLESSPSREQPELWWHNFRQHLRILRQYLPYEISLPTTIVAFGALASVAATYYNLLRITELFQNNSPCLGNSSYIYSYLKK